MVRTRFWSLGLIALALGACTDDKAATDSTPVVNDSGPTDSEPTTTDSDPTVTDSDPVPAPTVTITTPTQGTAVGGDSAVITYSVENFTLDAANIGGAAVEGSGHVHIYDSYGGVETYIDATADTSYTLTGLLSGPHTFKVKLANNDHTEIGVEDSVDVEVVSPSILITSPGNGAVLDTSSVQLGLQIGDFTINPTVGGANAPGEGHFHMFVDGVYFDYGTDPNNAWITRLTPGIHEITVELANNDHSLTGFSASVSIEVDANAMGVSMNTGTYVGSYDSATWPVEVTTSNWTLTQDSLTSGVAVPGEGHYHVYVNGGYYEATADASTWVYNQPGGDSILEVRLADATHTEYARDYVRVSCEADRPDITITSPTDGELVGDTFYVNTTVENYTLVDFELGRPNDPSEGHIHILVDGNYYTATTNSSEPVSGLPPGNHTIEVGLYNTDHSARSPQVLSTVEIEVVAGAR